MYHFWTKCAPVGWKEGWESLPKLTVLVVAVWNHVFHIYDKKKWDSNILQKKPASEPVGTRRKTNSYVGKPILTSEPVGFFFFVFFVPRNVFLA